MWQWDKGAKRQISLTREEKDLWEFISINTILLYMKKVCIVQKQSWKRSVLDKKKYVNKILNKNKESDANQRKKKFKCIYLPSERICVLNLFRKILQGNCIRFVCLRLTNYTQRLVLATALGGAQFQVHWLLLCIFL